MKDKMSHEDEDEGEVWFFAYWALLMGGSIGGVKEAVPITGSGMVDVGETDFWKEGVRVK